MSDQQPSSPEPSPDPGTESPSSGAGGPMVLLPFLLIAMLGAVGGALVLFSNGHPKKAILPGLMAFLAFSAWNALRTDRALHDRVLETFRKLGPAGWLGVVWAALPLLGSILLFANYDAVSTWLVGLGSTGLAIYVGGFVVLAGVGLLPTFLQAALGGACFGLAVGTPAALVGFTGAALIGYGLARFASGDRVEKVLSENTKWSAVRDALIGEGFWKTLMIVTLVRVPPNSPFALTNLVLSASGTRLPAYALGTLIGMAPRTAAAVYIGHLVVESGEDVKSVGGIGKTVVSVILLVIVLTVIGRIANKALERVSGAEAGSGSSGSSGSGASS